MKRCAWAYSDELREYHDKIWGKEQHDEVMLYKMLVLEGLQAGLSWEIVLKKEKAYEEALDNFDYHMIAGYDEDKYNELMETPVLIKNKLKMKSIILNAHAFIEVQKEYGSFDKYIWSYVNNQQVKHSYHSSKEVPAFDDLSTQISKDLKKKGFRFVGPTIIYSYLQAIGIYNDHEVECAFYD
ncbi:MAG: DNA-3-methyladenine glycosylase I [Coprobacillus sp.]